MGEERFCEECGKAIDYTRKRFCSHKCSTKNYQKNHRDHINQQNRLRNTSNQRKKSSLKSIIEINREALALGMSYGKYVEYMKRKV